MSRADAEMTTPNATDMLSSGSAHSSEEANARPDQVLACSGEMATLMRSMQWGGSLGPPDTWPQSLRTTVSILLRSKFPMLLMWGPELIQFYNDAFRPSLGADGHPQALGARGRDFWDHIWPLVGPLFARVQGGDSVWAEDQLIPIFRDGCLQEVFWTFSYSPILDESGSVGGILVVCSETTRRVQGERQMQTLRDLAARAAQSQTEEEAWRGVAEVLSANPADIPFVVTYAADIEGQQASLIWRSKELPSEAAPSAISLTAQTEGPWPMAEVARGGEAILLSHLPGKLGPIVGSAWPEPVQSALLLPIARRGLARCYGFLVLGLSPRRILDESYRGFFELIAEHIATAVANACAVDEEKRRANALVELDRAKTAFFNNVSHEFRTPITLMLGPTDDLLAGAHGELAPAQRNQLELVRRSELRLQRLVNTLLAFSRIEAGKAQARFEPLDLASMTQDLASVFRAAIERAGLRFRVDCPRIPTPVFVDRDMWEQIIMNLLSNAFKFTFEGEISLSLSAQGEHVIVQVRDTGVGVRPEDVPRLFERFHRVEGNRARTMEGSGIGLALVKELLRLHGGDITADSVYGVGTSFTITLPFGSSHLPQDQLVRHGSIPPGGRSPLAWAFSEEAERWVPEDEDAFVDRATEGNEPAAGTRPDARPPTALAWVDARILVADDNADMREYLRRILATRWTVETVGDGGAALIAAKERRPDIIITDVMMPRLDGFRLLKALKDDDETRSIGVIMLSARAGEESRIAGLEAGADDYLIKPFSAQDLVARVEIHLASSRRRAASDRERARLRSLFESAPAVIFSLKGPDLVYDFTNAHYARMIGNRNVLGLSIRSAFPEVVSQGSLEILEEVYRTGKPYFGNEAPVAWDRTNTGRIEQRFLNFVYVPSQTTQGQPDGILVFAFDVTDQVVARREAEQQRRVAEEAKMQADLAAQARDEFLTIVSHELRTPLTTLGLQLDGLTRALQTSIDPEQHHLVTRAEKARGATDRLEQLIEGMMEMFELTREHIPLVPEEVDLAALARAVVERLQPDARRASAIVEVKAESLIGLWDRGKMDMILTHLLSNALKFGAGKAVQVVVEAQDGLARFSVSDSGDGIRAEDQERIFGRFERATSSTYYGGLGLGLWVVRRLVTAMRGAVHVESEPGRGSRFIVEVPQRG